ncbi:MAG: golgi uridine diphosphate-N- acetylglucosamine transporter [Phylliscum demangeonii]|nr:MAG: golgi uridine diphosphate-N- acetylglucosamine transporter [Phylliscum demangeonii]
MGRKGHKANKSSSSSSGQAHNHHGRRGLTMSSVVSGTHRHRRRAHITDDTYGGPPIRVIDVSIPRPPVRTRDLLLSTLQAMDHTFIPRMVGRAAAWVYIFSPLDWAETKAVAGAMGLIFGGCCSNVYTLEAIIKHEPQSGILITFSQFILVAAIGYGSHFSARHPPFFLQPNRVPVRKWFHFTLLFFATNLLNNFAFGYSISIPVHIILRSGGSVMTMVVGRLWAQKRYTRTQVGSVVLLTTGAIIAAWADARTKRSSSSSPPTPPGNSSRSTNSSSSSFLTGLALLLLAQLLGAIQGVYAEGIYRAHGRHWTECVFYSHLLGLPLFLPLIRPLRRQFQHLLVTSASLASASASTSLPVVLVANALTQYACIRGVNGVAGHASALTVTIVLSVRKLVSLLLSIALFGNELAPGVAWGAVTVFVAGAGYAWASTVAGAADAVRRLHPRPRRLLRRRRVVERPVDGDGGGGGGGDDDVKGESGPEGGGKGARGEEEGRSTAVEEEVDEKKKKKKKKAVEAPKRRTTKAD